MPHDRFGNLLFRGQRVSIEATVTDLVETEDGRNVSINVASPDNQFQTNLLLNSQCLSGYTSPRIAVTWDRPYQHWRRWLFDYYFGHTFSYLRICGLFIFLPYKDWYS